MDFDVIGGAKSLHEPVCQAGCHAARISSHEDKILGAFLLAEQTQTFADLAQGLLPGCRFERIDRAARTGATQRSAHSVRVIKELQRRLAFGTEAPPAYGM
jgi:hypothetical protein